MTGIGRSVALLGLLLVVMSGCVPEFEGDNATVRVGQAVVQAEVVRETADQARGLAGRESLAVGRGMLFVYREPTVAEFWMRGMKFPIDLVWINDGVVIGTEESMEVDGGQRRYPSPGAIDMVLEVPSGWIAFNGIAVGSPVSVEY